MKQTNKQTKAEQPRFLINFNHDKKSYTELRVENYFPEKQLRNILIKFSISKTFRSAKMKLKVVNNYSTISPRFRLTM